MKKIFKISSSITSASDYGFNCEYNKNIFQLWSMMKGWGYGEDIVTCHAFHVPCRARLPSRCQVGLLPQALLFYSSAIHRESVLRILAWNYSKRNLFKARISSKRCPSLPLCPITYIPNFPSQKSDVKSSKKAQVMRTWIPAPNDPPQHAQWEVVECASTQELRKRATWYCQGTTADG